MTQSDLGLILGVTFQQVQKYENGANRLPASAYPLLFSALGLSPEALFGSTGRSGAETDPPVRSRSALELLRCYETLSPDRRLLILNLARELSRP